MSAAGTPAAPPGDGESARRSVARMLQLMRLHLVRVWL